MAFWMQAVLGLAVLMGSRAGVLGAESPEHSMRRLVVRSWGTAAGLPQNTINSIVQTRDGYLWLGTRDGAARFDGVRFSVFGLQEGLPGTDVSALFEDRTGTLWAGTVGGGLNRLVDGRFERVRGPRGETAGDTITAFAEDPAGRLWIGAAEGLKVWTGGQFVEEPELKEIAHMAIRELLCDHQGRIWVATVQNGLFVFAGGRLEPRPGPAEAPQVNAYCLLEDHEGQIWAGVGNWMVLRWGAEGGWKTYNQNDGLPFAYISSLAEDAKGTLWAGSLDEGLYRFVGGHFQKLQQRDGLSAADIRYLLPDRAGNLWVGTRTGGLNRLSDSRLNCYGTAQGLTNDFTRSVAETPDGTLWVATTGGGLYRGGTAGFAPFAPSEIARFYAHVNTMLVARDGTLWWGGARALLGWKDGRFTHCYTNAPWIAHAAVTALCEDSQAGLWIGTSEGVLAHLQGGQVNLFPHRAARGPVTALAQETNGFLWVGSPGGGLRRVRWGSNEILFVTNGLLSHSIRTLYLDAENTLWIGTEGGGLSRRRQGQMATFTSQQGLGATTVSQIVEDGEGRLWLGCNRGILCVPKRELEDLASGRRSFLHPHAYGANDGMQAEECSSGFCPAGLKTRDGRICFSTVKGLVLLDPHQSEAHEPPPKVLLEEALVNGKPVGLVQPSRAAAPTAPPARESELVIPPGGREIELQYTGIDFSAPEKVSFRYQLEGLDQGWVEAGRRRVAYYHRIPPGEFTFRVTACGTSGQWREPGASLRVRVEPYFWETAWFRVGLGLLLTGGLAVTFRVVEQRRYKRRLKRLELKSAVERERLRISRDMHDHLGGMLTQVSQLSDLGLSAVEGHPAARGHFERIGGQARNAVQALDEIVWATNPANDNLPRFADYLCRFADEFFESTSVRCWLEVPTSLPNLLLPAEVRHEVFLAVKEAFHNVVKHSGATQVWLRLALQQTELRLEIEDNGLGFDPAHPELGPGGNGLGNMRARLAACKGRAELSSAPDQGTRVRFCFPLPRQEA